MKSSEQNLLDYYLFLLYSLQLQLLQIRTSYKFNIFLVYRMICKMINKRTGVLLSKMIGQ